MTKQTDITLGHLRTTYKLEFRTWTGSAYTWTDYTDRLSGFGDISFQIERQAIPNAFSSSINSLRLRNDDKFFSAIGTLDGVLVNSSEPYGKMLYKRIVRLSSIDYDVAGTATTTVIFTGRVIDVTFAAGGLEAVCKVAGLDVVSKDQMCDGELAQRHPLGSDDSTTPSTWTASAPAATGEVAMYRFRQLEDDDQSYTFGWHRNKKVSDVLTRMSWALDDLATDIDDIVVYTEDEREICTSRNVPPDDSTVSQGTGDMRTRVCCWNDSRDCMVFGVGHKVYDYNPVTNAYTLRNTLTSTYQIVFMQYLNLADTNGLATRLVIVALDVSKITTPPTMPPTGADLLNAPAFITVFNATGSGAYSVATGGPNEAALGSDFFPCTHQTTQGIWFGSPNYVRAFGRINNSGFPVNVVAGENAWLPFEQRVYQADGWDQYGHSQNAVNAGSDAGLNSVFAAATQNAAATAGGEVFGAGFMNLMNHNPWTFVDPGPLYARWTLGQKVQCAIHRAASGGKLYFFTWDSTDDFRMRPYDLYSYALGSYIVAPNVPAPFGTFPMPISIGTSNTNSGDVQIHTMWLRVSADPLAWEAGYWIYNTSTPAWNRVQMTGGASGDDEHWQVMDFAVLELSPSKTIGILYNRATQQYRVVKDMEACTSWANTDAQTLTFNGKKDQPNMLKNLHVNENYTPDRVFWVELGGNGENGGAVLWSWDGTTLRAENKTPADTDTVTPGDPISSDIGVTCVAHTQANYPNSDTPKGIMFLVTCNDFEHGTQHPYGFYGVVQYCNFHSGFVQLLDLSGMSFFEARSKLAEKMGAVHYYAPDGTFTFVQRNATPGAAAFTFSAANRNYATGEIASQGWEEVRSEVKMLPYAETVEPVLGDVIKGESESSGTLEPSVATDPFERAEWRVIFTSTTAYDVYKLSGTGSSSTAKASSDINSVLRDIPDGAYLSLSPDNWSGTLYKADTFRFWVYPGKLSLQQLDDRDMVFTTDATTEAAYQRRRAEISSRFLTKLEAPDFAEAYLTWIKTPHPVVRIKALYDPAYLPLAICDLVDEDLGFTTSDNFKIIAVRHTSDRMHSYLDLQKI